MDGHSLLCIFTVESEGSNSKDKYLVVHEYSIDGGYSVGIVLGIVLVWVKEVSEPGAERREMLRFMAEVPRLAAFRVFSSIKETLCIKLKAKKQKQKTINTHFRNRNVRGDTNNSSFQEVSASQNASTNIPHKKLEK